MNLPSGCCRRSLSPPELAVGQMFPEQLLSRCHALAQILRRLLDPGRSADAVGQFYFCGSAIILDSFMMYSSTALTAVAITRITIDEVNEPEA